MTQVIETAVSFHPLSLIIIVVVVIIKKWNRRMLSTWLVGMMTPQ